jgi:hypothetical protein
MKGGQALNWDIQLIEKGQHSALEQDTVQSVSSCKLYYAISGRNAWHSTWIQRYSNGCMHNCMRSAKDYCEKRRVQGTVFVIKELPALAIQTTKNGIILVTEINTISPLSRYSIDAVREDTATSSRRIEGYADSYVCVGGNALGARLSFMPGSRFWRVSPPPKDAVMVLNTKLPASQFSSIDTSGLKAWSSYSNGSNYLLGWRERKNDVSSDAVLAISS